MEVNDTTVLFPSVASVVFWLDGEIHFVRKRTKSWAHSHQSSADVEGSVCIRTSIGHNRQLLAL